MRKVLEHDAPVLATLFSRDPGAPLNLSSPSALHIVFGLVQTGQKLGGEGGTLIWPKCESFLQKTAGCVGHAAILALECLGGAHLDALRQQPDTQTDFVEEHGCHV